MQIPDMSAMINQAKAMGKGGGDDLNNSAFVPCHGICDYSVGDGTVQYKTWYTYNKKFHGTTDTEHELWKAL